MVGRLEWDLPLGVNFVPSPLSAPLITLRQLIRSRTDPVEFCKGFLVSRSGGSSVEACDVV